MAFVFCLLMANFSLTGAQLNLYISKDDVNSYLSKYKFEKALGKSFKTLQANARRMRTTHQHVLTLLFFFLPPEMNFDFDLYLIHDNEPAQLLRDSRAFYEFMSPLQSSVKGIKMNWSSSPKVCWDGRD